MYRINSPHLNDRNVSAFVTFSPRGQTAFTRSQAVEKCWCKCWCKRVDFRSTSKLLLGFWSRIRRTPSPFLIHLGIVLARHRATRHDPKPLGNTCFWSGFHVRGGPGRTPQSREKKLVSMLVHGMRCWCIPAFALTSKEIGLLPRDRAESIGCGACRFLPTKDGRQQDLRAARGNAGPAIHPKSSTTKKCHACSRMDVEKDVPIDP